MAITVTVEDFQIGRVVSRTFGVLARNFVTLLIIAVLFMLPVLAANVYLGSPNYLAVGTAKGWALGGAAGILPLVCSYLLQAALVQVTITDLNGTRPSLGTALSSAFAVLLPVLAIALLTLLATAAGLVLLVIPGFIIMTGLCVVIPVRVAEHTGITQSLGRSWDLTREYRWKIFGLLVMYIILTFLLSFATRLLTGLSFAASATVMNNIGYIALVWLVNLVSNLLIGVGVTAIYYELRTVKEGMAPEQLAAAFD